jgi:hypothetical protein
MSLSEFHAAPGRMHRRYEGSVLWPVAPEWSTGEVLVGAAYRTLLLGISEGQVDRELLSQLPALLPTSALWADLLLSGEGLASPPLSREGKLPQLMPLVTETAQYASVLGKPRGRWDPGNLLLTATAAGAGPGGIGQVVQALTSALAVGSNDDVFAEFVEQVLKQLPTRRGPSNGVAAAPRAPAWRKVVVPPRTPSERFVEDLSKIVALKSHLTRRQWTVLIESLLRLGLASHVLWLCRLNALVFDLAAAAMATGEAPEPDQVEQQGWSVHIGGNPLLELGQDANPAIRNRVHEYIHARLGLNLLLHATEDAGCPMDTDLSPGDGRSPADALSAFLRHVASHREELADSIGQAFSTPSLEGATAILEDANPRIMNASSGFGKNLTEFVRYSLTQLLTKEDEQKAYDQAYVLHRKTAATNTPRPFQPGPATLIVMVHACCRAQAGIPASIDDFRSYLEEYGVRAPTGELQGGATARDLERLGLVVDSPDAGGGRLLVDPF